MSSPGYAGGQQHLDTTGGRLGYLASLRASLAAAEEDVEGEIQSSVRRAEEVLVAHQAVVDENLGQVEVRVRVCDCVCVSRVSCPT
jgi:hypothetical protein